MALNLGTLNTVFTATTADFDKKTKQVNDRLKDTEKRANRTKGAFSRMNNMFNRTSASMLELGSNIQSLGDKLRVLAFMVGTIGAAIVTLTDEFLALSAAAGGALVNVQLEPLRDRLRSVGANVGEVSSQVRQLGIVADEAGLNIFSIADGAGDFSAAFQAAGNSAEEARDIIAGFAVSASAMGQSGKEVNKILEDLAEATRDGKVTIDKLREAVSFTNDPLQTLSQALGFSERQLETMNEAGVRLNDEALSQLSAFMRENAGETDTLSNSFNRLINSLETLFKRFNKMGNIEDLKNAFRSMQEVVESDQAIAFMERMAKRASTLITETIPNLATAFVENFNTIKNVVKGTLGFLIGTAMGGLVGGAFGALIGASGRTKEVMGLLAKAFKTLGPAIQRYAIPAIDWLIETLGTALDKLEQIGKGLGIFFAERAVGPASLSGKLKVVNTELETARNRMNRLASEMADMDSSQITKGMREGLQDNIQRFLELKNQAEGLRAALEMTRTAGGGDSTGDSGGGPDLGGGSGSGDNVGDPLAGLSPRDRGFIMSLMDNSILRKKARIDVEASPVNDETKKMLFPNRAEGQPETPAERFLRRMTRGAGMREVPDHLREIVNKFDITISQAQKLQDTATGIGDAFGQAFEQAAMGAKDTSEILKQLRDQIIQTMLRKNITNPLSNMFSDLAGNILGAGVSATTGPSTTSGAATTSTGGMFSSGGGHLNQMAKGGVVNKPSIFGEAGPEAAVPLPDGRSIPVDVRGGGKGGGNEMNVVINDQRGADAPDIEQSSSTGPDGRKQLELTVRDTVSRQISRGEYDKAMKDRFGASPRNRRR